jgi:hypothetical protein
MLDIRVRFEPIQRMRKFRIQYHTVRVPFDAQKTTDLDRTCARHRRGRYASSVLTSGRASCIGT